MFKKTQKFDDLYVEELRSLWEALMSIDFKTLLNHIDIEKVYDCLGLSLNKDSRGRGFEDTRV